VDEILEEEAVGVAHLLAVAEVSDTAGLHSGEARISGVGVEAVMEDFEVDGVEAVIAAGVHTEEEEVEVALEDHVVDTEADEVPLLAVMEVAGVQLGEAHMGEVEELIPVVPTAEAEVEIQAHMEALLKVTAVREEDGVRSNAVVAEEEEAVGKIKAFSRIEQFEK